MKSRRLIPVTVATLFACGAAGSAYAAPEVTIGGLLEVEASQTSDFITEEDSSDIALATVELGLDASVNEWVSAHVLLLYEDDQGNDDVQLDEGSITLGNDEKSPFYLTVGRQYVPFGNFNSNLVSDPLTLELAETREDALLGGIEQGGFHASAYIFNGDADKAGDDNDRIDDFGLSVGYTMEMEGASLDIGAGYINNLADSDALQEGRATVEGHTAGIALHAVFSTGPFSLIGEYVGASNSFDEADLAFDGSGAKPSALNLELGYDFTLAGKAATVAVAHQRTDEAAGLGLPESRNMVGLSLAVMENTGLGFEYYSADDYATSDGGSGNSGNGLTLQLAVEF